MAVLGASALGFPWATVDPFLFCVYHDDNFPPGAENMGPDPALLRGRNMGSDFGGKDGWSMYHGQVVPGFPKHPHRGFETVTIARHGFVDHTDSLGASGRFGGGDVQWMTAGRGISHSEMFPLLNRTENNRQELFQIWMNLPSNNKMAEPYFKMLWREQIPQRQFQDAQGRTTDVSVVAGAVEGLTPLTPPPASWASEATSHVAIWTLKMAPGAKWTIPTAVPGLNRMLYFFKGKEVSVAGKAVRNHAALTLKSDVDADLENGAEESELLMLQGRPIGEPVVQHGPFVMNSRDEIRQAFQDYQRTEFGDWPVRDDDPSHPREKGRFAHYPDGHVEQP